MATPVIDPSTLQKNFGPSAAQRSKASLFGDLETERLVKTHCCFCSHQCGMQLKVAGQQVIGVEPWEGSVFNDGALCAKGLRSYMQSGHPDRLLKALWRDDKTKKGYRQLKWEQAISKSADAIRAVQQKHGNDAFAILAGASLTTEKAYLLGKFARLALHTGNIDHNGRLCMAAAASAQYMTFGIDRASAPWSDMVGAEVLWITGANIGECFPVSGNYIFQAREMGAKLIVVDPRITPLARTCDLFLPIRPGRDGALFNGVLKIMIDNGWIDRAFIDAHTIGFDKVAESVRQWTSKRTAEETGIAEKLIVKAAEIWGQARSSYMLQARGMEQQANGTNNCLAALNMLLATGRIGKKNCGFATITGQGNGQGGREHGVRCDQLPGGRSLADPNHRAHIAKVWDVAETELPQPGVPAVEIINKINRGEIKGLLSICCNPVIAWPNASQVRKALEKLEFYLVIDPFMNDSAHYADCILPGSLQFEDEGIVANSEGRVLRINKAIDGPGDARPDWQTICALAKALGREKEFAFASPKDIFQELRQASKGGLIDYSGISYEKIEKKSGIYWPCPSEDKTGKAIDHPGTPRLFEDKSWNPVATNGGRFYFPDGKARFNVAPAHRPPEDADVEYPLLLTTGRNNAQYNSGVQTRRIGPLNELNPEAKVELHPNLARQLGVSENETVRVETRRGTLEVRTMIVSTIRPDTIFLPMHWAGVNELTSDAVDPLSGIAALKCCAARIRRL